MVISEYTALKKILFVWPCFSNRFHEVNLIISAALAPGLKWFYDTWRSYLWFINFSQSCVNTVKYSSLNDLSVWWLLGTTLGGKCSSLFLSQPSLRLLIFAPIYSTSQIIFLRKDIAIFTVSNFSILFSFLVWKKRVDICTFGLFFIKFDLLKYSWRVLALHALYSDLEFVVI